VLIKNKSFLYRTQNHGILVKTRHFGKITAFNKNHGFRNFRDFLLSLIMLRNISDGRKVWCWLALGLERYQKSYPVPSTQYYWVLLISIPNTNTDISFLPCFLLELDTRSEVCCAIRASQMVLTKHWDLFGLLYPQLHSARHLRVQCPFTLCPLPLSLWPCCTRNKRQPRLILTTGQWQ